MWLWALQGWELGSAGQGEREGSCRAGNAADVTAVDLRDSRPIAIIIKEQRNDDRQRSSDDPVSAIRAANSDTGQQGNPHPQDVGMWTLGTWSGGLGCGSQSSFPT